jgi:hypothetical protein
MEGASKKKVNLSDYDLTITLGTGSFGRVLLCKNKKTGEYFAMKRLKKAEIIKLRQVDHVISENTILADIDHPFLVSYCFLTRPGRSQGILPRHPLPLLPDGVHRRRRALHLLENGGQTDSRARHVLLIAGYADV